MSDRIISRSSSSSSLSKSTTPTGTTTTTPSTKCTIENFRQAAGLKNIYRCGSTDNLYKKIQLLVHHNADDTSSIFSPEEQIILNNVGLILDLRSQSERDDRKARIWTSYAPGGRFHIVQDNNDAGSKKKKQQQAQPRHHRSSRSVIQMDVLSRPGLLNYIEQNWMSTTQLLEAKTLYQQMFLDDEDEDDDITTDESSSDISDNDDSTIGSTTKQRKRRRRRNSSIASKLHRLRIDTLNSRGLPGLNEAILEVGKKEFKHALKHITVHFENNPGVPIAIHCVQGKDRTGLLIMLCQSILGLSDEVIISDYHLSHQNVQEGKYGAATTSTSTNNNAKVDRSILLGAPKEAMELTLDQIRSKYGSVCPGYFDSIGFTSKWRNRLLSALLREQRTTAATATTSADQQQKQQQHPLSKL